MCVSNAKDKVCLPSPIPSEDLNGDLKMTSSGNRNSRRSKAKDSGKASRPIFVNHNYQDHYYDPIYRPGESEETTEGRRKGPRGGVITPFPERLYKMLSEANDAGFTDVVSWQPHGRCFIIHDPKRFVEEVMPKYFSQSKLTSFQRQVNLYGFRRLTAGKDRGAYYHQLFLRGRPDILKRLMRIRIKGTGSKSAASPSTEPDFYKMHPCLENAIGNHSIGNGALVQQETSFEQEESSESSVASYSAKPMAPVSQTIVTPPLTPLKPPTLVTFGNFKSLDTSCDLEEHSWETDAPSAPFSMSLKSFASRIVRSEQKPTACPVTPESSPSQIVASILNDHDLMMVSPFDSPCPSPCPSEAGPLEVSPMDYFDSPTELDEVDVQVQDQVISPQNPFAGNALISGVEAPVDSSLDPLLLLDEVANYSY